MQCPTSNGLPSKGPPVHCHWPCGVSFLLRRVTPAQPPRPPAPTLRPHPPAQPPRPPAAALLSRNPAQLLRPPALRHPNRPPSPAAHPPAPRAPLRASPLVVLGGYGRTDPLLKKPFYPNGLVVGILTWYQSKGLEFESQCVHFEHPSAGGCQRSTGDPRLIVGKGYRLVVLGGYGRTDPLLKKPFYPNGLVVGILTQPGCNPKPSPSCLIDSSLELEPELDFELEPSSSSALPPGPLTPC
ncbi:unnamed protein product [Closterium sp. NIES-54]